MHFGHISLQLCATDLKSNERCSRQQLQKLMIEVKIRNPEVHVALMCILIKKYGLKAGLNSGSAHEKW